MNHPLKVGKDKVEFVGGEVDFGGVERGHGQVPGINQKEADGDSLWLVSDHQAG